MARTRPAPRPRILLFVKYLPYLKLGPSTLAINSPLLLPAHDPITWRFHWPFFKETYRQSYADSHFSLVATDSSDLIFFTDSSQAKAKINVIN